MTLVGIVIELMDEHPENAELLMLVTEYAFSLYITESGITISVSPAYLPDVWSLVADTVVEDELL